MSDPVVSIQTPPIESSLGAVVETPLKALLTNLQQSGTIMTVNHCNIYHAAGGGDGFAPFYIYGDVDMLTGLAVDGTFPFTIDSTTLAHADESNFGWLVGASTFPTFYVQHHARLTEPQDDILLFNISAAVGETWIIEQWSFVGSPGSWVLGSPVPYKGICAIPSANWSDTNDPNPVNYAPDIRGATLDISDHVGYGCISIHENLGAGNVGAVLKKFDLPVAHQNSAAGSSDWNLFQCKGENVLIFWFGIKVGDVPAAGFALGGKQLFIVQD